MPVGRKALVGAAYLAPVDLVRPLVPEEFQIVSVLPGRTLATVFMADYGPGSTLEYHEFGLQPALVRFRGVTAAWNSLLLVDSPASVRGGRMLGFNKQLAEFDWREEVGPGGRVSGECVVRLGGQEVVRIRYRQGRVPLPGVPVRAAMVRDDMVLGLLEPPPGPLSPVPPSSSRRRAGRPTSCGTSAGPSWRRS